MRLLSVFLIAFLAIQCKDDSPGLELPVTKTLSYRQQSSIQLGEDKWSLEFSEIKENSLCPPESVCIWLGRLVVSVQINDKPYTLAIGDLLSGDPSESLSQFVIVDDIKVYLSSANGLDSAEMSAIELVFSENN